MGTKKMLRMASCLILLTVGSILLSQENDMEGNVPNTGYDMENVYHTRSLMIKNDDNYNNGCDGSVENGSSGMFLSQFFSKIPFVGQHISSSHRKLCKCAKDAYGRPASVLRKLRQQPVIAAFVFPPKTGSGSIMRSFIEAYRCRRPPLEKYAMLGGGHFGCPDKNKHLFKTHSFTEAQTSMEAYQNDTPSNRQCVVLTGIRDPQTRLPSIFMEQRKATVCTDEWASTHTPEELLDEYQAWLLKSRATNPSPLPELLEEFGSKPLSDVWDEMNTNNGYSKISHPLSSKNVTSGDTESSTSSSTSRATFHGCDLLFLRIEDGERWRNIIETEMPAVIYQKHTSREQDCPMIKEHYKVLKDHVFTQEELQALVDKDPWNKEYLRLYGHNAPSQSSTNQEEKEMTSTTTKEQSQTKQAIPLPQVDMV